MTSASPIDAALDRLVATGIIHGRYAPRFYRFLWRRGLKIPPPRIASFRWNVLFWGPLIGIGVGVLSWLLGGTTGWGLEDLFLIVQYVVIGGLAGLFTTFYLRHRAHELGLPTWAELTSSKPWHAVDVAEAEGMNLSGTYAVPRESPPGRLVLDKEGSFFQLSRMDGRPVMSMDGRWSIDGAAVRFTPSGDQSASFRFDLVKREDLIGLRDPTDGSILWSQA